MKRAILSLMLVVSTAYAKPPKWVQLGSNDTVIISIATDKTKLLKRGLYKVLIQFKYPDETTTGIRYANCDTWILSLESVGGSVAGSSTMADSVLEYVCPK